MMTGEQHWKLPYADSSTQPMGEHGSLILSQQQRAALFYWLSSSNSDARQLLSVLKVFYNGASVKQVDVPTTTGMFGILGSHVPTLQVLRPGLVTVFGDDGSLTKYFVSSGSVTVNADSSVQLLAEEAVTLDMIDPGTAKSNLEKAQAALLSAGDEVAKAEAQINVEACEAIVKALE